MKRIIIKNIGNFEISKNYMTNSRDIQIEGGEDLEIIELPKTDD